jgi:WD40 repeat protein
MQFEVALKHTFQAIHERQRTLCWSLDGSLLASAGSRYISLWDPVSGRNLRTIACDEQIKSDMIFSPDRRRIVTLLVSGAVAMWSVESGARIPIIAEELFADCVSWSPDRTRLAAVSKSGITGIWENYCGLPAVDFRMIHPPLHLAWSLDSQVVASVDLSGSISIWNMQGSLRRRFNDTPNSICALAWSAQRGRLAAGSEDHLVRVWQSESGRLEQILKGHEEAVIGVAFAQDGSVLATKSLDGTVRVWNCEDGFCIANFEEQCENIPGLPIAFHPRDQMIASIDGRDGNVCVRSYENKIHTAVRSKVFISYSHKDTRWLNELRDFLKPLEKQNIVTFWDDNSIKPGEKWREEITDSLAGAKVAILLVTQNFLASDFIVENELPTLLDRAEKDGLKIIWIAVRECLYAETRIKDYQAANDPSQPLAAMNPAKRQKTLIRIASQVKSALTSD